MQENLDPNIKPVPSHLLGCNSRKEQFSRIHQAGENHIVHLGNIADFHTIGVFDDDCPAVVRVIRFAEEVQFIIDL